MKYYKTDSRKISFGEYWHISTGIGFLMAWFNKVLGIPMKLVAGIPGPQPFREKIIGADAVPKVILGKLNSSILDLQNLGFDQFWFYALKDSLTTGASYGVQALHQSHKTMGKVIYVSYGIRESFVLAFLSELNDGIVFGTTNRKQDFNSPLTYFIQRRVGAKAGELLELHEKQLAALSINNPAKTITDFDQVAAFEDKTLRLSYEDKIRRGIWVEMTDLEVAALRPKRTPPPIPS